MKRLRLAIILLIYTKSMIYAQHYSVWRFSDVQLDFNQEPAFFTTTLNDSITIGANGYTPLRASICDDSARLKYYTQVDTFNFSLNKKAFRTQLYDRNGTLIPTGGFATLGYQFGQYTLMLNQNDSVDYFIIAIDALYHPTSPLHSQYMRDSVGLWSFKLTQGKNTDLRVERTRLIPHRVNSVTANRRSDGAWQVYALGIDTLYTLTIESNSQFSPFSANALNVYKLPDYGLNEKYTESLSSLIFVTQNGQKLVYSYRRYIDKITQLRGNGYSAQEFVLAFFDLKDLKPKKIEVNYSSIDTFGFRSIASSPNDSLLYFGGSRFIYQYNLYAASPLSSLKTIKIPDIGTHANAYTLQLGQNSKIYVGLVQGPGIGVIWYPNKIGDDCQLKLGFNNKNCTEPSIEFGTLPRQIFRFYNNICYHFYPPFSYFHGYRMNYDWRVHCDSLLEVYNLSDTFRLSQFRWYLYRDGVFLDSIEAVNPKFKLSASGSYYLKMRAHNGKGYHPWYSDSMHLEIPEFPQVALLGAAEACRYAPVLFKDSVLSPSSLGPYGVWWQWKLADTTVTNDYSQPFTTRFTDTGIQQVRLVYHNGYCSDTAYHSIWVREAAKPGFLTEPAIGCAPLVVSFSDRYADKIDSVVYDFGQGERLVNSTHVQQKTTLYPNPGTYRVVQQLYSASGCVSTDTGLVQVLQGFDSAAFAQINISSRISPSLVELAWEPVAHAVTYRLERRGQEGGPWQQRYQGLALDFVDSTESDTNAYVYRLWAVDTCEQSILSDEGNVLVLKGTVSTFNEYADLYWNKYQTWPLWPNYELEKLTGIKLTQTPLTQYRDLDFFEIDRDSICYVARALHPDGIRISQSNICCLRYHPQVYIPNAFTPNGDAFNQGFKPLLLGVEAEGYQFELYNRWGSKVFSTTQRHEYWNGDYRGAPAAEGVYFYKLSYLTKNQAGITQQHNLSGTVTLLR